MTEPEKAVNNDKHKEWEATQLAWDDTDFLNTTATKLMKLKWKRLNIKIAEIIEKEVVEKNEYISLLDIGAGRGEFYHQLQPMLKNYVGIEPSHEMLKDEQNSENFELKRGCGEEISFNNEFEACLIKEVLDHTFDPEKVIKNAFAALKENGLLIVSLTNKNAFYKLIFKGYAKKLEKEHKDHLYNFNPAEVKEIMEKAGFTVENNYSINYLKMPRALEQFTGLFPEKLIFFKLDVIDSFMSAVMPGKGGGFIMTARKPAANGGKE